LINSHLKLKPENFENVHSPSWFHRNPYQDMFDDVVGGGEQEKKEENEEEENWKS